MKRPLWLEFLVTNCEFAELRFGGIFHKGEVHQGNANNIILMR